MSILVELEAAAQLSLLERRIGDRKVAGSMPVPGIIRRCVFRKNT